MRYRELVEGQSEISSRYTMDVLTSDEERYAKMMAFAMTTPDEEIPENILEALGSK